MSAFDIIHADLPTSPIVNSLGHKYYLLLIDDFTHYVWTITPKFKSQAYQKFIDFRTYILTQFEHAPLEPSKVIMVENLKTTFLNISASIMVWSFVSLVLTHLLKMVKSKE